MNPMRYEDDVESNAVRTVDDDPYGGLQETGGA